MIQFTSTFTKTGKDKRSELIALLVSLLFSLVFLGAFALFYEAEPEEEIRRTSTSIQLLAPDEVPPAERPQDPNDKFRIVPEHFADVDFENWQYGSYKFGRRNLEVTLADAVYELASKEGGGGETFSLSDVLYADVTGDGKPEAIVNLSHVSCGGSCDGGSDLFYIYQSSKKGFRKIWEYETGSRAYGCGLKSLTVMERQVALEMFGHCWEPASSFEGSGKFMVRDVTRAVFYFNGKRFVKRLTEVTAAPIRDLRYYTPEVHIGEY